MIYISDDFCGEFILNSPFLALGMLRYRSVLPAQNGRLSEFAYFSSDPLPLRTSRCGTKFARKYIGLIKDRREVRVR